MMTSIKTKNGYVPLNMTHGFDCIVRGQIVENFRSYEAARLFQKLHNSKADAIIKDNISKPSKERQTVPSLCSIRHYTA